MAFGASTAYFLKFTKNKNPGPKQPAMFLQENEVSETQKKVVATQIFVNFHPYLGKVPILTNIFQLGWFNHQLANLFESNPSEDFVRLDARRCAEDEGLFGLKSSRLSVPRRKSTHPGEFGKEQLKYDMLFWNWSLT